MSKLSKKIIGNSDPNEEPLSPESRRGDSFANIMERRLSRRDLFKWGAMGSAIVIVPTALTACGQSASEAPPAEETPEPTAAAAEEISDGAGGASAAAGTIGFTAIEPDRTDEPTVPAGYTVLTLIRWGDPLTPDAPEFDAENQTGEAQSQQFGYNCDMVAFFPLPQGETASDRGLLAINHEYTNTDIMFIDYDAEAGPTQQQADVELAAHGISIVEIQRNEDGIWSYNRNSEFNRRLTAGTSELELTGPATGHDLLKTSEDSTGTRVIGTLNNCAGGKTPWGTYVAAEENFHQYFGNLDALDDEAIKEMHARYGVPEAASRYMWENLYSRFDVAAEPNELFRFGWMVEVNPYDPTYLPKKRTAMGRFRHEAATFVVAPGGQVVAYSGDDARFEYVYKFVTDGTFTEGDPDANMDLLDEGTLYVARFHDDGTGEWLPLVYGEGPLTDENGFTSQGDVLIKTRQAADLLEATPMDRPEDIETNPANGKVYIALTNNTNRGVEDNPATDEANPRVENRYGHIIELTEAGDDHATTSFSWEIFLLCGDPSDESTYFADFDKEQVSAISCPDNVAFDNSGNLWIATDGMPGTLGLDDEGEGGYHDGFFACPVAGEERGFVRQFFSSVAGSEVCGPEFTPDNTTLFLAIQHPGDGGTWDEPVSTWPDSAVPPRPSLVTIVADDGSPIGTV